MSTDLSVELKAYAATHPDERRRAVRVQALFDAAQAGHFTLPASLYEAARAEAFVRQQAGEARAALKELGPTSATSSKLAADVVAAARTGKPLADIAERVAQAEQAERVARLKLHVLVEAEEMARHDTLYAASTDEIIEKHLKPALAEVLATVRAAAPKLAGTDVTDPGSFLRQPAPVRQAFTSVQDAVVRYRALRAAQAHVSTPLVDAGGWFRELRDPGAHGVKLGGPASRPQPWPSDAAARLLWLAQLQPADSVWLPRPAEQDARAQEYLEELNRERKGRGIAVAAAGF